jgi:hypothetical protein
MKLVTAIITATSLLALATTANAASITSGKKLEIDVDAKKIAEEGAAIWAKVGGWCAISEWHPAIAKCEESKDGDVEFRTLTLKDGGVIKEKLVSKTDRSYKYQIIESPLPVKNYEAQFSLTPDDDDEDEVNLVWAATYDAADGKTAKDARGVIDGIFQAGIDSLKGKVK